MRARVGFSIVELLVVIAVIGILVALIVPAVMSARESARRTQCLNNLHQIGVALHNYHEQFTMLPPSMIWGGPPGEPLGEGKFPVGCLDRVALGVVSSTEPERVYANWLILLLPALDNTALYQKYDSTKPVDDDANAAVRGTVMSVFNCPSDTFNRTDNMYRRDLLNGPGLHSYARGNYAMNMGPDRGCFPEMDESCTDGFHVDSADLEHKNMTLWGSGVGGVNVSLRTRDMTSGLTNIVAVDEIRAGVAQVDPRGTWALGFAGASATARHGLVGGAEDDAGPNNSNPTSDEIIGCEKLTEQLTAAELQRLNMPCPPFPPEANTQATARSQHPAGVHVMMLDGFQQIRRRHNQP